MFDPRGLVRQLHPLSAVFCSFVSMKNMELWKCHLYNHIRAQLWTTHAQLRRLPSESVFQLAASFARTAFPILDKGFCRHFDCLLHGKATMETHTALYKFDPKSVIGLD